MGSSKRVFFLMVGVVILLIIGLVGGAYGVNVMLKGQSSKLVKLKAQEQSLSDQQNGLAKEKKEVAQYSDLNSIAKAIVPQDKDQAEAVREIVNIADANKVKLANISFPSSNLGTTTVTPSTGASASTPSSSSGSSLTQLTQVAGIKGVYNLQITLQSDTTTPITYTQFLSFLQGLENNRRTAQVSSISITPLASNRNYLSFSLILNEY
ncbi:MAG TPA: hypothetical protein V6C72_04040, partial [Chroococcales cyanobacterium]